MYTTNSEAIPSKKLLPFRKDKLQFMPATQVVAFRVIIAVYFINRAAADRKMKIHLEGVFVLLILSQAWHLASFLRKGKKGKDDESSLRAAI